MTCLSIIQSACRRVGLPTPNAACSSSDSKILQLVEFANEELADLTVRYQWSYLTVFTAFYTTATEVQTGFDPIAQDGQIQYIVNDTLWNRDLRLPVFGPLSSQRYQQQYNMFALGPWSQYQIRGQQMYFIPTPAAGQLIDFHFVTNKCVAVADSSTFPDPPSYSQKIFLADTDVTCHDEQLVILGTIWRWKSAKGLPFEQDLQKYEKRLADAMARDGTKPTLNMGNQFNGLQPIVMVSAGSWPIT